MPDQRNNRFQQAGWRKIAFTALLCVFLAAFAISMWVSQSVLRIRDLRSNEILLEIRASPGDQLFFGWIHSLENIPWHEYYYISSELTLILDTISFTGFGAGIPENRGRGVRIEDGIIYMYDIDDEFEQLRWLNSHYFVQDIALNGKALTRGRDLPQTQLILRIERRGFLNVF